MSWRVMLGVAPHEDDASKQITQITQNTQKQFHKGSCADIADIAYKDSIENESRLLEVLAEACKCTSVTPAEVRSTMSDDDVEDWYLGVISIEALTAFAKLITQRREMDYGYIPNSYTKQAQCAHCGPVWLWVTGCVQGCPWCWNRAAGRPIPRPVSVQCGDCRHFERIDHAHLGHCGKGEKEPPSGLWDKDKRYCSKWLPIRTLVGVNKHDR